LFGSSILAAGVSAASLLLTPSLPVAAVVLPFIGPLVVAPWTPLCACVWFHPERGNLQPPSKVIGHLPAVFQAGVRWYGALLLALLFFVGFVVWPVMSLAWL